nr:hypothetical protein [Mycolicibacterium sp. P1-18]
MVASCATNSPAPSDPAPTTSSTHGTLAECLSKHGVPAAAGPAAGPPPGVDEAAWRKAMQECSPLGPGPTNN